MRFRRELIGCLCLLLAGFASFQANGEPHRTDEIAARVVSLKLPDRTLIFSVTAGTLPMKDEDGRVDCDVGLQSFTRQNATGPRPVTFVIGGGPGTSSAYLNLGALGPWRISFNGPASASRSLLANSQTWLDFTDLVFIDPPGLGYGLVLSRDAKVRERVWSVEGDIDLLSDAIASWLRANNRLAAPKLLVGQSYGGFRAPRMAEALHRRHGIALNGLILVSPILDYGWRFHARTSPLAFATLLPSFAAVRMESEESFDPSRLAEVEDYASSAFIADYLRGLRDPQALSRLIDRVAAITGLSADVVSAARGRVDETLFAREFSRKTGKIISSYDPMITAEDPDPASPRPDYADPFLAAVKAPLTEAMSVLLTAPNGNPQRPYIVSNETVFEQWQWNADHGLPESISALRKMLALDEGMQVLVAHGISDLQTPYFESTLILNQLPDFGGRVTQRNYRGGHMFYSRDETRIAFRRDVEMFLLKVAKRP